MALIDYKDQSLLANLLNVAVDSDSGLDVAHLLNRCDDAVYYGCTIEDNAEIGFRDETFDQLAGGRDALSEYLTCIDRDACLQLFELYNQLEHTTY